MDKKNAYDAIYPPENAIKIWHTRGGWACWIPPETPPEIERAIRELTKTLLRPEFHQAP